MAPRRRATQALAQSLESQDSASSSTKPSSSKTTSQALNPSFGNTDATSINSNDLQHFLITAVVTLALQTALSAAIDRTTGGELGSVSRHFSSSWKILGLTGWKIVELATGWYAGYGNVGIAPFIALLHLPNVYFLNAYYDVSYFALVAELVGNFTSATLAFSIYRRPDMHVGPVGVPVLDSASRSGIILPICATYFSAALYGSVLLLSLYTWLPTHLALHWDGLRTLDSAYDVGLLNILKSMIGMGWCTVFLLLGYTRSIFDESLKSSDHKEDDTEQDFNPVTASLSQHFAHNVRQLFFWREAKPAGRSLLKHATFLAMCLTISAAFQSCATIEGCETGGMQWLLGPLPWGALWGSGLLASSIGFGWMAGVLA